MSLIIRFRSALHEVKTKVTCNTHDRLLETDISERTKYSELVYGNALSSGCFSLNITNDNLLGGRGLCDSLHRRVRTEGSIRLKHQKVRPLHHLREDVSVVGNAVV